MEEHLLRDVLRVRRGAEHSIGGVVDALLMAVVELGQCPTPLGWVVRRQRPDQCAIRVEVHVFPPAARAGTYHRVAKAPPAGRHRSVGVPSPRLDAAGAAPLWLLVAAPATAPGVDACLKEAERAARAGSRVHVLWTEDGLGALSTEWPARLADAGAVASLCARSARARRVDPAAAPRTVRWSSLTSFVSAVPAGARLWTLFP